MIGIPNDLSKYVSSFHSGTNKLSILSKQQCERLQYPISCSILTSFRLLIIAAFAYQSCLIMLENLFAPLAFVSSHLVVLAGFDAREVIGVSRFGAPTLFPKGGT